MKIQPGTSIPELSSIDDAGTLNLQKEEAISNAAATDPVTRIALELVEGRIDTETAVNALIEQTLSSEMIAAAPDSLRREVEAVLRDAIETEPYLAGLTRALD